MDKAHSVPTDTNRHPDYTALSPRIEKDTKGFYYLFGDYHPDIKDPPDKAGNIQPLGQFRKLAGERDVLIATQMKYDPDDTKLVLSKDSGAGSADHTYTLALMMEEGIKVVEDKTTSNVAGKKLKDFLPFANACMQGLVFIVEDSFDADSLKLIYSQLERFDGERSTSAKKDDIADGIAMTFNAICNVRVKNIVVRNQKTEATKAADLLNNYNLENT